MKIVKPCAEIIKPKSVLEHIEKAYRVCYKSEDLIKEGSAERIIRSMAIGRGHWSPTEHFVFILEVPYDYYHALLLDDTKFINKTYTPKRCVVSGSARAFVEAFESTENNFVRFVIDSIINSIVERYDCAVLFETLDVEKAKHEEVKVLEISDLKPNELETHGWFTAKFICDRAIANEIVRHRTASYCQESTRYCNYGKEKFGDEITVIEPCYWKSEDEGYIQWEKTMRYIEEMYMQLLHAGSKPEEARSILPNSLKTELIMTANYKEWRHFFNLRCDKAAHPQMREVALMLLNKCAKEIPTVFDDIGEKFKNE